MIHVVPTPLWTKRACGSSPILTPGYIANCNQGVASRGEVARGQASGLSSAISRIRSGASGTLPGIQERLACSGRTQKKISGVILVSASQIPGMARFLRDRAQGLVRFAALIGQIPKQRGVSGIFQPLDKSSFRADERILADSFPYALAQFFAGLGLVRHNLHVEP